MYKIGEYFENCTSDIDWYTKDISNTYYSIANFFKMNGVTEYTFAQRRHINGQQTH